MQVKMANEGTSQLKTSLKFRPLGFKGLKRKIFGAFGAENWSLWAILLKTLVFLEYDVTPFFGKSPPIATLICVYVSKDVLVYAYMHV